MDILVIGDVCIDEYIKISDASVVCDVKKEDCKLQLDYSDKIPVEAYAQTLAGNSNNVGLATSKLGLQTSIYAEMGDDTNADLFLAEYKKNNIDTSFCIKNKNAPTNVHQIIVFQGERTILSYHYPYKYTLQKWDKPKWIYYSSIPENFDDFQVELVEYLKQNPDIGVAFNPGTFHLRKGLDKLKNILNVTHILMVNKEEAKKLVGEGETEELHINLQKLGPKLTVITNGSNGSSSYDGKNFAKLGLLVEQDSTVVDKTGAGDAHSAGFISAVFYGKNMLEALKWGTINAAGVVKEIGSISGQKTKSQIEETLKKGVKFTEFVS